MLKIEETINQIIYFINNIKENKREDYAIINARYLLNQILRQIKLPTCKYYFSEKAASRWEELTNLNLDDIMNYWYNDKITLKIDVIDMKIYKGGSSKPEMKSFKMGDKISYRSIFHDDHILPISKIQEELLNLKELNYESVKAILSKISICRMLKEEDRLLPRTRNRISEESVINGIYKDNGIKLRQL